MKLRGERLQIGKNPKHSFVVEHFQRYQFASPFVKGKKVLDLGCGEGYGSKILKEAGAKQVIGIDIDKTVIREAENNYSAEKLTFQRCDAQNLPFPNETFDVIVSFELIEHLKNYQIYLKEVRRVLKLKGLFILSTPNKDNYRGQTSPFHTKEFALEELKTILSGLFPKIEIFGQRITNSQIADSERNFFDLYQKLSFGLSLTKKLFLLIPPEIKAYAYKKLFGQTPQAKKSDFIISKNKLLEAITFLVICRK